MRSDKEILEEKHKKWGTGTIVRKQDLMIELLLDIRKIVAFYVTNYHLAPVLDKPSRKIWKDFERIWKEEEKKVID